MKILFTVESYSEAVGKYWDVLMHEPMLETEEADDEFFVIRPYRVVIPELGLSFREGEWLVKEVDGDPELYDNGWVSRGNVVLLYDESEEDASMIRDYTTAGLDYTLENHLRKTGRSHISTKKCNCIIETDEFIDENTAYMLWPGDEDEYEEDQVMGINEVDYYPLSPEL